MTWDHCVGILRMKGFIRDGATWWRPGDDQTAEIIEATCFDDWLIVYGKD